MSHGQMMMSSLMNMMLSIQRIGKGILYARIGLKGNYYVVPNGTVTICHQAFLFHEGYLVLYVPASIKVIGDDIFGKDGGKIIIRD